MKQKLVYVAMTTAFLPFISNPTLAGSLSGLDDFTPTGKVYADDMNRKMQDISNAVNDNNQKINDHINDTNIHHDRYTDTEAVSAVVNAVGPQSNDNPLNHARYTNDDALAVMGDKSNDNALNHDRYTDTDALGAMGDLIDANPLNHDRYTNDDAVKAMEPQSNDNPLNHSRYTDAEAQAALSSHVEDANAHHIPPMMWASIDQSFDTDLLTIGPLDTPNDHEINAIKTGIVPANGFLVITGMAYIENNSTSAQETLYLIPRIDPLPAGTTMPDWAAKFIASPKPINTAVVSPTSYAQTVSYTITIPITEGSYTVSQAIRVEDGNASLLLNTNNLTVTYYPQQLGTIVNPLP